MSEASRARRQRLLNRLEELNAKYGRLADEEAAGAELDPSWGPVGSLARLALGPAEFARLAGYDEQMRAQGASPGATSEGNDMPSMTEAPPPVDVPEYTSPPAPASRVLSPLDALGRLDQYGETPLFGCPVCGAESAKASLPIDLWHCTACGTGGRARRLRPRDALPGTAVQRV